MAAGAAGKTVGVAFTSKGFATASVLATAAVSVGGVAAVVRLAPDSTRLFKPAGGLPSHIRAARQPGSTGHARTVHQAGSRASATSVGLTRSATHTGAASRGVHFRASHGHGRAIGRYGAKFGEQRQFGHSTHGHGGQGWHRGWSVTHHDAGVVAIVRHDRIEGYAGGRVHHTGRHLGSAHRASASVPHSSHPSWSASGAGQHGRQVGHEPRQSPPGHHGQK
jgi:hypothetical protein